MAGLLDAVPEIIRRTGRTPILVGGLTVACQRHAWAAATATPVHIRFEGRHLELPVAESGPLIAMKLQSMMNRTSAKEATDSSTS